jgi:ATP-dependent DNA helicase RecG
MFDDRLEIYSPGGMADGTLVQEREITKVPSTRRNPIIAEVFHRLDFIERRGSGFKKILAETSSLYGYTEEYAPQFQSTPTAFHIILKNMNYNLDGATMQDTMQVATQDNRSDMILAFCTIPRTRDEIQLHIGIANRDYFRKSILKPLLESGQLKMTIPDKPNSRNQKYVKAK